MVALFALSFSSVGDALTLTFDSVRYVEFVSPVIFLLVADLAAILTGLTFLSDRRSGFMQLLASTPVSRSAIAVGKVLATSLVALLQGVIMLAALALSGIDPAPSLYAFVGVAAVVFLSGLAFAGVSLLVGIRLRTPEAFWQGLAVVSFPLFLVSNALSPLSAMPAWFAVLASANPATYAIAALRYFLIPGSVQVPVSQVYLDVAVVCCFDLLLIAVSVWHFVRRMDESL